MSKTVQHTTTAGNPIILGKRALALGSVGPTIPHDSNIVEKLAEFNRERVPERVIHAKGGGAFGDFTVTGDVSAYTCAKLFQPGATCQMATLFSSSVGQQGFPDSWRDVRGFACKFYTTEGNYDIVGNNTPVFFIKDALKYADFIHSQKRLPGSGLRDADRQWDFLTLSPETSHQVTYLMGDRGLPSTWREMNGYGAHTYQWINAAGQRFWVKYHMIARQGAESLSENAELITGASADFYRQDLFDAITAGDYPTWDLKVQIMEYDQAKTYRFNPFDLTKIWSHADYPLVDVGHFTLNRNPGDFFAEIEQSAFSPANMVRGTDISPDRMLMARVFSLPDAQRHRVGTSMQQINAPHGNDEPQWHSFGNPLVPVYAPKTTGELVADPRRARESFWQFDGDLVHAAATRHANDSDFGQAGTLYREVFSPDAKARFLATLVGQGKALTRDVIKQRFIQYWTNVDTNLGHQLAKTLGLPAVKSSAK